MGNNCSIYSTDGILSSDLKKLKSDKKKKRVSSVSTKSSMKSINDITLDNYEIIKVLGRGSFGTVVLCKEIKTEKLYAIKILNKKKILINKNSKDRLLTERKILSGSNNPKIVKLYLAFQNEYYLYFVMEYLHGGSLQQYITSSETYNENRIKYYAAQILEGLLYLNLELKVIYRDLKSENILLDKNGDAKLSDFGLAKYGMAGMSFCGTPEYIAPEIIKSKFN
jgi:serine/threonine protein kinase